MGLVRRGVDKRGSGQEGKKRGRKRKWRKRNRELEWLDTNNYLAISIYIHSLGNKSIWFHVQRDVLHTGEGEIQPTTSREIQVRSLQLKIR